MKENPLTESPLWEQFQAEARRRRKRPVRLLTDYMRECLESWEDQKLDAEISRQAQTSGYAESDAVEIVRRHRAAKKKVTRATS